MWISSGARHALPKSLAAVALALVVVPLTVSAGPDGRRLTLGDNRANQEAAPISARSPDQLASSTLATPAARPVMTPTQIDTAPPIRVAPSNRQEHGRNA